LLHLRLFGLLRRHPRSAGGEGGDYDHTCRLCYRR
jgi:hypothetical protein